jgi:hypothetical protein
MELAQKVITAIDINITFQDETQRVHFGKGDWEVNLLIEYRQDLTKTPNPLSIHSGIMRRMEHYVKKSMEKEKHNEELKTIINKKRKQQSTN